ncbi:MULTISPECIES: hypothetical protein [unclassified Streptomyces]|uniref:hypothetical protein n=1 Tax=unclassified Streptomyces TaxID=2593676 RepID=UPI00166131FE|nr:MULTISPECIES: hypothetical protein [unclassified Streptomyces]MBD0710793.1 hypothetical protein [Streptomyces sp. CBMA291]MBD0718146.1 hypothetical protein [Streptomyces sp. CBMA370]
MTHESLSAPWDFSAREALVLNPRHISQSRHGWDVEVSAVELASLAAGPDAARVLGARRGFLGGTPVNLELAALLRERPESFGWAHRIVLGADEVHLPEFAGRGFSPVLHIFGVECIDGFQRLRILAEALAALGPEHLARSTVRLEIHCGRFRDVARALHDDGHRLVNATTAQDGLIRCPNLRALMAGDWEKEGFFDPRRGVSAGPHRRCFTMREVTRGLACLSPLPSLEAVHLASTDEGLELLWAGAGAPLYLGVFHDRMSPLGVVRAVEAYAGAREALRKLPGWMRRGAGLLIDYAPDLIAGRACRGLLPFEELHVEAGSRHDWRELIEDRLPGVIERTAKELIGRYEVVHRARGGKRTYKDEAGLIDVWRDILR